jgi:hypothetical protein
MRGSGGLTPQFLKRSGGVDKVLDAQRLSPFQTRRRGQNDDPIRGLRTMTAIGNFFKDPV